MLGLSVTAEQCMFLPASPQLNLTASDCDIKYILYYTIIIIETTYSKIIFWY